MAEGNISGGMLSVEVKLSRRDGYYGLYRRRVSGSRRSHTFFRTDLATRLKVANQRCGVESTGTEPKRKTTMLVLASSIRYLLSEVNRSHDVMMTTIP